MEETSMSFIQGARKVCHLSRKMTDQGEGIYASPSSGDVGNQDTDRGLTLPPKIPSEDTLQLGNASAINFTGIDDALKTLQAFKPEINYEDLTLRTGSIYENGQFKDAHPAKRRRLATDLPQLSLPRRDGPRSLAESLLVSNPNLNGQEAAEQILQSFPGTQKSIPVSITTRPRQNQVEKENLPLVSRDLRPSAAQNRVGKRSISQKVSKDRHSSVDEASWPGVKTTLNSEYSSIERLQWRMGNEAPSFSALDYVVPAKDVPERIRNNLQSSYDEKLKGEVREWTFGNMSAAASMRASTWDPDEPVQSIERDQQDLGRRDGMSKASGKPTPPRATCADSTSYGVSDGLSRGRSHDAKLDPFWPNHTIRNSETQQNSLTPLQSSPQFVLLASTATQIFEHWQQDLIDGYTKSSLFSHTIPEALRLQLDTLLKKFCWDKLFQKSIMAYVEQVTAARPTDEDRSESAAVFQSENLESFSLDELKDKYKTLEEKNFSLNQSVNELKKKSRRFKDHHQPKRMMPSKQQWLCTNIINSKSKRYLRSVCGTRNNYYKVDKLWVKQETCSRCHVRGPPGEFKDFKWGLLEDNPVIFHGAKNADEQKKWADGEIFAEAGSGLDHIQMGESNRAVTDSRIGTHANGSLESSISMYQTSTEQSHRPAAILPGFVPHINEYIPYPEYLEQHALRNQNHPPFNFTPTNAYSVDQTFYGHAYGTVPSENHNIEHNQQFAHLIAQPSRYVDNSRIKNYQLQNEPANGGSLAPVQFSQQPPHARADHYQMSNISKDGFTWMPVTFPQQSQPNPAGYYQTKNTTYHGHQSNLGLQPVQIDPLKAPFVSLPSEDPFYGPVPDHGNSSQFTIPHLQSSSTGPVPFIDPNLSDHVTPQEPRAFFSGQQSTFQSLCAPQGTPMQKPTPTHTTNYLEKTPANRGQPYLTPTRLNSREQMSRSRSPFPYPHQRSTGPSNAADTTRGMWLWSSKGNGPRSLFQEEGSGDTSSGGALSRPITPTTLIHVSQEQAASSTNNGNNGLFLPIDQRVAVNKPNTEVALVELSALNLRPSPASLNKSIEHRLTPSRTGVVKSLVAKKPTPKKAKWKKVKPIKTLTAAEQAQVESANATSNTFLGGPRKAWEKPIQASPKRDVTYISSDESSLSDFGSLFGEDEEPENAEVVAEELAEAQTEEQVEEQADEQAEGGVSVQEVVNSEAHGDYDMDFEQELLAAFEEHETETEAMEVVMTEGPTEEEESDVSEEE